MNFTKNNHYYAHHPAWINNESGNQTTIIMAVISGQPQKLKSSRHTETNIKKHFQRSDQPVDSRFLMITLTTRRVHSALDLASLSRLHVELFNLLNLLKLVFCAVYTSKRGEREERQQRVKQLTT